MAERDPEILSEEEAARLWERAAQLQVEAARRIEAPQDAEAEMDDDLAAGGYALAHVRSAAVEAGINTEFVEAALGDLRAERSLSTVKRGNWLAHKVLKKPPDTLTVRRIIEATPREVLTAMEALMPGEPFRLTLTDQKDDPLDQGLMTFDIQAPSVGPAAARGFSFATREAGIRQLFVSLRATGGSEPSCEMTVYGPVTAQVIGTTIGTLVTTVTGVLGFVGASFGAAALVTVGMATGIAPVVAIGGALAGGGLGLKGFRTLYHFAMRQAQKALEGLVGAVSVRAQGGWQGS